MTTYGRYLGTSKAPGNYFFQPQEKIVYYNIVPRREGDYANAYNRVIPSNTTAVTTTSPMWLSTGGLVSKNLSIRQIRWINYGNKPFTVPVANGCIDHRIEIRAGQQFGKIIRQMPDSIIEIGNCANPSVIKFAPGANVNLKISWSLNASGTTDRCDIIAEPAS